LQANGAVDARLACPSTGQCTAVIQDGFACASEWNTFDPTAAATSQNEEVLYHPDNCPIVGHFQPGPVPTVACPSGSHCVAVDSVGHAIPFDPNATATPTAYVIDSGNSLNAVACPTAPECVAVDGTGHALSFNSTSPGQPPAQTVASAALNVLACPSIARCVTIDKNGSVSAFAAGSTPTSPPKRVNSNVVTGLDCPVEAECVAVDASGNAFVGAPAPVLSNVHQARRRWRERTRTRPRDPAPVGTAFMFTVDSPARVTLIFTSQLPGRLSKGHCVAVTKRNRRRQRCTRTVRSGSLAVSAPAGRNRVAFDGHLPGHGRLRPGTYTISLLATGPSGAHSATHKLTFTIVG
jgi:hypothetical protein